MSKLSQGKYEASVVCNNAPMDVHGVETDGATTSGWIASQEDAAFEVEIRTGIMPNPTSCRIHVDGVKIRSVYLGHRRGKETKRVSGIKSSPTVLQRLHFSSIKVSDDESGVLRDTATLANLGVIRIELWRIRIAERLGKRKQASKSKANLVTFSAGLLVHEQDKKLGGHHATLGIKEECQPSTHRYKTDYLDKNPVAVFEFRYRPKEILQAQGIIPLNAYNQPSGSKKRRTEHPDENANLAAEQPAVNVARIKSESKDEYLRSLEARVRELEAERKVNSENAAIRPRFVDGNVIDLTSD